MTKYDEVAPFFNCWLILCCRCKNTLVGPVEQILKYPNFYSQSAIFEVGIEPSCNQTCTAAPQLLCPSSWKLYLDDFPCFGSSLAHLELKLKMFEVDDDGDNGDDDMSHHHRPNFEHLQLSVHVVFKSCMN